MTNNDEPYMVREQDGQYIPLIPEPYCKKCSYPLDPNENYTYCYPCYSKDPEYLFKEARVVGIYSSKREDPLSQEIYRFKVDPSVAPLLGECMVYVINNRYPHLRTLDYIIPIPERSGSHRDYDKIHLLAHYVSQKIGIKMDSGILYWVRGVKPQHGLNKIERRENVKGAFGVRRKLRNESILLIDDTFVSGSTLNSATKILLENGASEVRIMCLGRDVLD